MRGGIWCSWSGEAMRRRSSLAAVFLLLQLGLGLVAAQTGEATSWKTLSGGAPVVIAKGGYSGLLPDSSAGAYSFGVTAGSSDVISWCDVRLTKDGVGICLPDLKLGNCTDISRIDPQGQKHYTVNGVPTSGWFPIDYNFTELSQVSLIQEIYSRSDKFDYSSFAILAVGDVESLIRPHALWLNVQHDIFYRQHNLSMRNYIISISKQIVLNYISSPEVDFLRSIAARVSTKTKLVFRFLDKTIAEPSTNQSYGSLLKNLTNIKTFASGILVPKNYIWPVTSDNYLLPYTSVVSDAHEAGLEIYAADFANDNRFSYNYSYDPIAEYLSFIDNRAFSVDGVLSDHPLTPSEAIGCFANLNKSTADHGKPLIISHYGASGDFPDCTDLAYKNAVDGGADVIDCPVQVTRDGIFICMSSIDLTDDTTVLISPFNSRLSTIPEIKSTAGIFTFKLTWDEIKKLQATISSPAVHYSLERNPRHRHSGNFLSLSDFLNFAKDKDLYGISISVEHAAFMAQKLGVDVIDGIISALDRAGYSNQSALEVMIQSSDSSVLLKLRQQTKYKLVYMIDDLIWDADSSSLGDIKKFADSVAIQKKSAFVQEDYFITNQTNLVPHLQAAGLSVYVYVMRNEFVDQAWDFLSDSTLELDTYAKIANVDGFITEFPTTARRYKRGSSCADLKAIEPGALFKVLTPSALPPALAPLPVLNSTDVMEPPLPPVATKETPLSSTTGNTTPPAALHSSSGKGNSASIPAMLAIMACMALLPNLQSYLVFFLD